jgi:hypothetical protein
MPYPNEHSCRLEEPGQFDSFARKNCDQKVDGKCIDVIYGIKSGKSKIQALRFPKKSWTADAAKKVCSKRGGSFEPAGKDFSEITSAEEITDPSKIQELLQQADENSQKESVGLPQTTIEQTDRGTKVIKHLSGQSILQVKGMPEISEIRKLAEKRGIPWQDAYVSRMIPYWASDERVDRHGDIVRQNWAFNEFSKNNIMLYSHSWDMPPIGAVLDWSIGERNDSDYFGRALYLLTLFATKEQWEWADTVFRLVSGGFLKSGSVGFYPGTIIDVKDDKEREELGLGRWGFILDNNALVEWSPTSVPANVGAHVVLNSMKSKNLLRFDDAVVIRELERMEVKRGHGDLKAWQEIDMKLRTIWKDLFGKDLAEHKELDVPFIEHKAATTTPEPKSESDSENDSESISENVEEIETCDMDLIYSNKNFLFSLRM